MSKHRPTPLCGPVPDGLVRITVDVPSEMFRFLEQSSLRRGMPLDSLLVRALLTIAACA